MRKKSNHNELFLAVLQEAVSAAILELAKLKNLIHRAKILIEESEYQEEIYRDAGDLILDIPKRIDLLEEFLRKTTYALSLSGEEQLKSKIPLEERSLIEEVKNSFIGDLKSPVRKK